MRIGVLNPGGNVELRRDLAMIRFVAERLGHTCLVCNSSQDVVDASLDFVLSLSLDQPKLTSVPTYAVVHLPRPRLLSDRSLMENLFTFDGYFAINDRLQQMISDLLFAARRDDSVGYFLPSCHTPDWNDEVSLSNPHLAYFASQGDVRPELVRLLADALSLEPIGRREDQANLTNAGLSADSLLTDPDTDLRRLRAAGVALVLMSAEELADDIVPRRFFEVCAAGALAIAHRSPWLMGQFGDSVLYVDQLASAVSVSTEIRSHMDWIRTHPAEAASMASKARQIFADYFSLEKLLPNVLDHHVARSSIGSEIALDAPLVSVVVRCGGRSPAILERALGSIRAQDYRRLQLVLISYTTFDPSECLDAANDRFEGVVVQREVGAGRSRSLWAGLAACTGDLISILDDDDEWMPNHISSLVRCLYEFPERGLAFSGMIVHYDSHSIRTNTGVEEARALTKMPVSGLPADIPGQIGSIPIIGAVFRRDLLDRWALRDPGLETAQDGFLIGSILERTTPVFSFRATAIQHDSPDGSGWRTTPSRHEEEARMYLRMFGRAFPPAPNYVGVEEIRESIISGPRQPDVVRGDDFTEYPLPASFVLFPDPDVNLQPMRMSLANDRVTTRGNTRSLGPVDVLPIHVEPPAGPWEFGLILKLRLDLQRSFVLRVTALVLAGPVGFGILRKDGRRFIHRVLVPAQTGKVIINLPVPCGEPVEGLVVQNAETFEATRVILTGIEILGAHS